MLEKLKKEVCEANKQLVKNNLVMWTSGNVSARDSTTNYVVIKPSGVLFEDLTPGKMVVVDLDGNIIEGNLKPSVDTTSHLYVYRHKMDINSIVHTHSPYATSFAIRGENIPIYTTTSAAVFGTQIPVSNFAYIGEEEIGKEIIENIGHSPVILLRNHGVFTLAKDTFNALKFAVVLEETAQVVHLSLLRGDIEPLPEEVVSKGYNIYLKTYGQ
ncbi:L-ribulose-5-phosphate 4-epimerase [Mammaliicoccus lentus]|uniref:L-ribulose-5-phosphate 4-epimerase n=1 Tax=Mammaliicoccus lentus TaxID=42858 RepID=UPI003CF50887